MIKLFWSGLLTMLLLSGCGWNGTPTRHNDVAPPTSITITAELPVIAAKTSTKLKVTGDYSGKYTLDLTDQAVWSSDSPGIADFSAASPNRVVAHAPGTAILTANVRGVTSTFQLTVSNAKISAVIISPVDPTIPVGLTTQFTASGSFSDSTTQDITPDSAWASDTPNIATISNADGSKGFAHALAVGTSTIRATFDGMSDTTVLTVSAPVPVSITITTPASDNLIVGANRDFTVTATMSDGTPQIVTPDSEWSTSDAAIATVGNAAPDKGKVTGVAAGSATISAVYAGLTATANVTVAAKVVQSLAIDPPPATFLSITSPFTFQTLTPVQFTATATYNDGSTQVVTAQAAWTSSLPNSVSVNNGLVTPISANTAIITASFEGLKQTVTVIVP
ncbi:Ig-like domain-containing protein [Pelotalea chapellei]|uniref:Ig-like domain-containing protein n=1 Tax=Pelotalea chapellei TaxID=44671 RepID=A0ABS5U8R7_9BACT|nr:Ig-like domain-containing protein [Pelotalea chapellei]MBT1072046.1 Ig-like domain-containing protein [Pelotalea chapellei]